MYAVLVSVSIESGREAEAAERLQQNVVPVVQQAPGAVHGYWLEPTGGHGYATILFETEDQAKAAAGNVGQRVPDFVTLDFVQVQKVVANF